MMKIAQKRISAQITPELLQVFQKNILAHFTPLIASMKKEYWSRISLPSDEVDEWIAEELAEVNAPSITGDLLMTDPDTLLYYMFKRDEALLEAGIITKTDTGNLAPFCEQLLEIINDSDILADEEWEDVLFNDDVYQTIKEVSHIIKPGTQEVEASGFLAEELALRFLERIKGSEATSLYKLVDARELPRLTPVVDRLEKMGLLTKDFVVICSKTGQPILKVSSRSAIEETSNEANKCFICGNPLSREIIDEIVSCSDFGKKLVEDNYWFPVRILSALQAFGIPNENVHVQMTENGIINVFLILNEQSYLFILCNKKLTLDDAYFVNAYISAFSINHALVICTEKLSAIMQRHIKDNNRNVDINFIDSLRNLDEAIGCYLLERGKEQLTGILEPFTKLTPVKIQDLVLKRVARERPGLTAEISTSRPPIRVSHPAAMEMQKIPPKPVIVQEEIPVPAVPSAPPPQAFQPPVARREEPPVHAPAPQAFEPPAASAGLPQAPQEIGYAPSFASQAPPMQPPPVQQAPVQGAANPAQPQHPGIPQPPRVQQAAAPQGGMPPDVQQPPQAVQPPQVVAQRPARPQGAPYGAPGMPQQVPPHQAQAIPQGYAPPHGITQQIPPQGPPRTAPVVSVSGVPLPQAPQPQMAPPPITQIPAQAPPPPVQHMHPPALPSHMSQPGMQQVPPSPPIAQPPAPHIPQGPPQAMPPSQPMTQLPPVQQGAPPAQGTLSLPSEPSDLEDIDDQLFMMEEVFPMDDNAGI
jgi:hypothetical protein